MDAIDGAIDSAEIGSEGCQLIHDLAELKKRESIDGAQDSVAKRRADSSSNF